MNEKNHEPPSPADLALACLVAALEERLPGISNAWVEHAESDALHADLRRLHAQAPNPVLAANLQAAMTLARNVRFVVLASGKDARRKRKGRG